jgi:hypothetical protein
MQEKPMASLFIGNISNQDHDFVFSLGKGERHHMRKIVAGGQIELKGIDPEVAGKIIEHHAMYGMRDIAEVPKERAFVGLCYSDQQIKRDGLMGAIEHNIGELAEEGKRLRDQAAVAADQSLIRNAPDTSELKASVVEIKELETKKDGKSNTEINEVRTIKPESGENEDRRGRRTGPTS